MGLGVPVIVGLHVVGLDDDLHVVGLAVVGMMLVMRTSVPSPQRQQAIFDVNPALANPAPYKEHCVLPKTLPSSSILAYYMQLNSTLSLS